MLECKCSMFKELKTNQDNETQLKVFSKYVVLTKNYFVQHYVLVNYHGLFFVRHKTLK